MNPKPGNLGIILVALAACFLAACDGREKSVSIQPDAVSGQPVIPKALWGDYQATQASYNMRDLEGRVLMINGQTVRVPATRNRFTVEANRILWVQDALESRGSESVRYEPGTPKILEGSGARMLIECDFSTSDGRSRPTLRFQCDIRTGGMLLLGDRGSGDSDLRRR